MVDQPCSERLYRFNIWRERERAFARVRGLTDRSPDTYVLQCARDVLAADDIAETIGADAAVGRDDRRCIHD